MELIKISRPKREKREKKNKFTSRDTGEFVTDAKKEKKRKKKAQCSIMKSVSANRRG